MYAVWRTRAVVPATDGSAAILIRTGSVRCRLAMAAIRGGSVAEKSTVCRCLGRLGEDRLDVLGEAHVEHLVGLVQDDRRHAVELQRLAADEVEGPPRRGDDDVGPALEGPQLRAVRLPAVDRQDRRSQRAAVAMDGLGHLHRQLAGRDQDEPHRAVAARPSAASRCRSGRAKAAVLPVPVAAWPTRSLPCEQRRDRLPLDRRRLLVAELDDRLHQAVVEAQGREARNCRRSRPSEPFRLSSSGFRGELAPASDVAERHGLPQAFQRVAGGDELLADVALVADLEEGLHDRRVVDLLVVVELAAAGIARRVDVADVVLVLAEPA